MPSRSAIARKAETERKEQELWRVTMEAKIDEILELLTAKPKRKPRAKTKPRVLGNGGLAPVKTDSAEVQ